MTKDSFLKKFKLSIADITIAVNVVGEKEKIIFGRERNALFDFISEGPSDFSLNVCCAQLKNFPPFFIKKKIFDNETTWSFYERKDRRFLWLDSPSFRELHGRMVIIEPDFKKGMIYQMPDGHNKNYIFNPLSYPFDQALMINLLSLGRGVLIHTCGTNYQGQGLLFVGASGSGKTTIANLWNNDMDVKILNDDRIVIRKKEGVFRIYGTPWHGTGKFSSPDSAPLKKIYFLKHSKKNKIKPLDNIQATTKLLATSFSTFWDKKGMSFTLEFCAELAKEIPCYELGFIPDKSMVDFVKDECERT